MAVGAVGGLRGVREAIGVAHAVLTYTQHTLLVGQLGKSGANQGGGGGGGPHVTCRF